MKNLEVVNNKEKKQYELHFDGLLCKVEYIITNEGEIYLTHTEVPYQIEGQGLGSKLVEKTLEDIDKSGLRLVPLCPFVAGYIQKNPQWKRIIMKGINV